ncbi:phosphoribosyltransferase-like protein [Rhexocercosporidium sp. MPI-PUGE-AT-0058]|nr:phosphoribosyltransferase-like protein [Rhexocercosporidium sp. MPI-PUGE-AT-0058]
MSSSDLPQYKKDFLKAAIDGKILKFGQFELKSKRISPYFFNAGLFYTASLLRSISTAYAQTIISASSSTSSPPLEFDILFGPAYKGIPLAAATVDKLAQIQPEKYGETCYSFDRKEAKDHGEGGSIVGAPLKGKRVLIVDDVVTAGTAKREAISKIRAEGGIVVGILVALDRMEKLPGPDGKDGDGQMPSAIGEIRREYGIPVLAILTLDDIIGGLKGVVGEEDVRRMEEYRAKYKASD